MSTERLTPEEVLHAELLGHLQYRLREKVLIAMKDYAAQEVDHKTKQLKEERDMAINLLRRMIASCDGYPEVLEGCTLELNINNFFTELNQQNEG